MASKGIKITIWGIFLALAAIILAAWRSMNENN